MWWSLRASSASVKLCRYSGLFCTTKGDGKKMRFLLGSCGVHREIASDQICTIRREGGEWAAGVPDLVSDDGDADDHVFAGEWNESVAGERWRQWLPDGTAAASPLAEYSDRGTRSTPGHEAAGLPRFGWSIEPENRRARGRRPNRAREAGTH
jgi:hypothetical protein